MKKTALVFAILFNSVFANAQRLKEIEPKDILKPVGSTINLFNILTGDFSAMQSPFLSSPKIIENATQSLDIFLASDEKSVAKCVGSNVSGNISAFFASANMDIKKSNSFTATESLLRICLSASTSYGNVELENTAFKPEAENLKISNPLKFVDMYGDYYVSSAEAVKKLIFFIDVKCQNEQEKASIENSIGGGVSVLGIGASINVSSSQMISQAYQNDRCRISYSSLGIFDNALLAQIPGIIKAESKQGNNFDLFLSLTTNLIQLMSPGNPATEKLYYQNPSYSSFQSLGLPKVFYLTFQQKLEKHNAITALNSRISSLKNDFSMLSKNSAYLFLPNTLQDSIKTAIETCGILENEALGLLLKCSNAYEEIIVSCTIPDDIIQKTTTLEIFRNNFGKRYKYNPLEIKSFDIVPVMEYSSVSVLLQKKWSLEYRNPKQFDNNAPYKKLDKHEVEVNIEFNSTINVKNYDPLKHKFKFTGRVYDFTLKKDIAVTSLMKELTYYYLGDGNFRITGTYTLFDPNDLYSKNEIGFILDVVEISPADFGLTTIKPVPLNNSFGQPIPKVQGIVFTAN